MQFYPLIRPFGIFCLLVALVTWGMDWFDWVEVCRYCRFQRTIIGLLGLLLIVRRPGMLTEFVALLLASFGVFLSTRQFMDNYTQGFFDSINIYLAPCAFFLIIAEGYILFNLERIKRKG